MKKGVLLLNLGSPDSTDTKDVRTYLRQFLGDPRVLDNMSDLKRKVLVDYIITPSRAPKSAAAYKEIWTDQGSPLILISEQVRNHLQERVSLPVEMAMRYGNPSTESGIRALLARGVEEIFLIPLYPQYALSSYETAVAHAIEVLEALSPGTSLVIQPPFYQDLDYIDALIEVSRDYLDKDFDHMLFSYHGVPLHQVQATDPSGLYCMRLKNCCKVKNPAHAFCYRHQCYATTKLFAERAGIPPEKYSVSFQSRMLKDPWLTPYTDHELARLPATNIKKLLIISPAFVSDCLETIEELGLRGREEFLSAGGQEYHLVPCLNDHPRWIDVLQRFVDDYLDDKLTLLPPTPEQEYVVE